MDNICFEKQQESVAREKTLSFEEEIISKEKKRKRKNHASIKIISAPSGAIVFITLQMFFPTRASFS